GFIGEVGDGFPVGRPGRSPLHDARCIGQITDLALLGGDGEHLAVRFKHGADTSGRDGGTAQFARYILEVGTHFVEVGGNLYVDGVFLAAGDVVNVHLSELLVSDA